jgi:hypothetical protein
VTRPNIGLFYLAMPYSKYPGGLEEAFKLASREAGLLLLAGVPVYSPIAHFHPIAMHAWIDPFDYKIWLPANEPMIARSDALIVLRAESWSKSFGMAEEIKAFEAACKPIFYMDPGIVPSALMAP